MTKIQITIPDNKFFIFPFPAPKTGLMDIVDNPIEIEFENCKAIRRDFGGIYPLHTLPEYFCKVAGFSSKEEAREWIIKKWTGLQEDREIAFFLFERIPNTTLNEQ